MLNKSTINNNIIGNTTKMPPTKAPLCKGSWQTEGLTEGLVLAVMTGSLSHHTLCGPLPLMLRIKGGKTGGGLRSSSEGL